MKIKNRGNIDTGYANIEIDRQSSPRPDFYRQDWTSLDGEWDFCFDDSDRGQRERWFEKGLPGAELILVPFCYQCERSGIRDKSRHERMWYQCSFNLAGPGTGERVLLHFGAVDYEARVWVNGCQAGAHRGGGCGFTLDITDYVVKGDKNRLTVRAEDKYECMQPRGKQFWDEDAQRIWYTPTSGIWQSVWIENTGGAYLESAYITPDIDRRQAGIEFSVNGSAVGLDMRMQLFYKGKSIKEIFTNVPGRNFRVTLDMQEEDYADEIHYWSPEHPNLYGIRYELLRDGRTEDVVDSYFGMRKISVRGGEILLNNRPYYQKLVLDQGYWPDTLMTPPDLDALRFDIEMTKRMGFNGVRKHQKMEDPRFYYLADTLGLLVWAEMPSGYEFCSGEITNLVSEWMEFVKQSYNHPSIITWVPFNESWGIRNVLNDVRQQEFVRTLYHLTKAFDPGRLVSSNDGWEQLEDSDICGIHDYIPDGEGFAAKYKNLEQLLKGTAAGRMVYADGNMHKKQPIMITEYGGVAFESRDEKSWGYYGAVKSEEEFLKRYGDITDAIKNCPDICGYCYTQLSDVMQEANGLMDFRRRPKADVEKIREINER